MRSTYPRHAQSAACAVLVGLLLALSGCSSPMASEAASGHAEDPASQDVGASAETAADSGAIYSPVAPEFRAESPADFGRAVESTEMAQDALTFSLLIPVETFGRELREVRVLGGETAQNENSVVLSYDGIQLHEELAESEDAAEARVEQVGYHGLAGFDDRFMRRAKVRGYEALAWDAADVPAETSEGGIFRPGVRINDSGIVWHEGDRVYTIIAWELDAQELQLLADSME